MSTSTTTNNKPAAWVPVNREAYQRCNRLATELVSWWSALPGAVKLRLLAYLRFDDSHVPALAEYDTLESYLADSPQSLHLAIDALLHPITNIPGCTGKRCKRSNITVGGEYIAKVAGKVTTVRVLSINSHTDHKGKERLSYSVLNTATGRKTLFRSHTKFRSVVSLPSNPEAPPASANPEPVELVTTGQEVNLASPPVLHDGHVQAYRTMPLTQESPKPVIVNRSPLQGRLPDADLEQRAAELYHSGLSIANLQSQLLVMGVPYSPIASKLTLCRLMVSNTR